MLFTTRYGCPEPPPLNIATPAEGLAAFPLRHRRALVLALMLAAVAVAWWALPSVQPRRVDTVAEWNAIAFDACAGLGGGTRQSRALAMTHLAIHDALNSIRPVYATYARGLRIDPNASPEAAIATAAHDTLIAMAQDHRLQLDEAYAQAMHRLPDDASRQEGIAVGNAAARAILAMRRNDHLGEVDAAFVRQPFAPGRYEPTPPNFDSPIVPGWHKLTPFAMHEPAQFRPPPPPALDSEEYAHLYDEVKQIGGLHSERRTEQQTDAAKFWSGDALASWNQIARNVVNTRARDDDPHNDLDPWQSARLFAMLDVAMADSFISGWEAKFHYLNWRPVTAIRRGDTDGNAATAPDPAWQPLLPTPAHPEYPSTHSILAAASAEVLRCNLGEDSVPFEVESDKLLVARMRRYDSFSQAAKEVALSRLYAGAHFRIANDRGLEQGKKIGEYVCTHHLQRQALAAVQH